MAAQATIKIQLPGTVIKEVPETLRGNCLPGFFHACLSGNFGQILMQSVVATGIIIYYLSGELLTELSGRLFLPSDYLAVWLQLEGAIRVWENSETVFTFRPGEVGLIAGPKDILPLRAERGKIAGVLCLYPAELVVSILSFYPHLADIGVLLEAEKPVSIRSHRYGIAVAEKLYILTHTPFLAATEEFYRRILVETVHQVFSDLSSEASKVPVSQHDIACLHKAKEYIDGHLLTHSSIREIARHAGINQLKLKVGFREVYGTGLYGYLREQRLRAAHISLTQTRLTVKEISGRAGYRSVSNFCTAYKRRFGITPGQARKAKSTS